MVFTEQQIRGNSDITDETVRIIIEEVISQMAKLEENKVGRKSQILKAINTAITEMVIHELQWSIGALDKG